MSELRSATSGDLDRHFSGERGDQPAQPHQDDRSMTNRCTPDAGRLLRGHERLGVALTGFERQAGRGFP